jgi:hypothetical protein
VSCASRKTECTTQNWRQPNRCPQATLGDAPDEVVMWQTESVQQSSVVVDGPLSPRARRGVLALLCEGWFARELCRGGDKNCARNVWRSRLDFLQCACWVSMFVARCAQRARTSSWKVHVQKKELPRGFCNSGCRDPHSTSAWWVGCGCFCMPFACVHATPTPLAPYSHVVVKILQENECKTYKRLTLKCPNQQKILGTMDFCQITVVQIFCQLFCRFLSIFLSILSILSICQFFVNFCEFF